MGSPYFTFIPGDYDNCLGIDYFSTKWQYTDILDWPSNTERYWRGRARSRIPLVQNILRNHEFCQYYLDHLEYLLDIAFTPDLMMQRMGPNGDGLWERVSRGAYLESATPYGQPSTGRQFTNDEIYLSGFKQQELRHGQAKIEGIAHYTRMRYDSARAQLAQLRTVYSRGDSGANFPHTMEALPTVQLGTLSERARRIHRMLGERQEQMLPLLAAAGKLGATSGDIARALEYDHANAASTLNAMVKAGLLLKDESSPPFRFRLVPELLDGPES
jgi:hypothetical protein